MSPFLGADITKPLYPEWEYFQISDKMYFQDFKKGFLRNSFSRNRPHEAEKVWFEEDCKLSLGEPYPIFRL
jgi:hypothetical protein